MRTEKLTRRAGGLCCVREKQHADWWMRRAPKMKNSYCSLSSWDRKQINYLPYDARPHLFSAMGDTSMPTFISRSHRKGLVKYKKSPEVLKEDLAYILSITSRHTNVSRASRFSVERGLHQRSFFFIFWKNNYFEKVNNSSIFQWKKCPAKLGRALNYAMH